MSPHDAALELTLGHGHAVIVAVVEPEVGPGALVVPGRAPVALDAALAALCEDERAHAAALPPVRRRDWVAGRWALHAALARAGAPVAGPVLADDRGAPVLPAPLRGSVSHKRGVAVALAARDEAVAGGDARGARVGVDVEVLAPSRLDLSRRVLTDAEREAVAGLDARARGVAVALRFSLKEAVYKAIDPFVRRYVGFREVAVWPGDGGDGVARVEIAPGGGADLPRDIEAGWVEVGELVIATARARR